MLPLQSAKKRIKNIQQELGFFMHYVFFYFGSCIIGGGGCDHGCGRHVVLSCFDMKEVFS